MLTKDDLQAIRAIMREETDPIKQDMAEIKESLAEVREATNYLLELVDGKEKAIRKLM